VCAVGVINFIKLASPGITPYSGQVYVVNFGTGMTFSPFANSYWLLAASSFFIA
jgi:hypothetical protein